jgi:hypothetical protein
MLASREGAAVQPPCQGTEPGEPQTQVRPTGSCTIQPERWEQSGAHQPSCCSRAEGPQAEEAGRGWQKLEEAQALPWKSRVLPGAQGS